MKKIITAMENQKLNKKLKEEKYFEIPYDNIQYREAIIDILKINKKNNNDIDILIIDEMLPGEIDFSELITNILKINKKIKINFILKNENSELKKNLINFGIKNIYYNQEINWDNFIRELKEEKYIENNDYDKNNEKEEINEKLINKEEVEIKNKILIVLGEEKSGKSELIYNIISLIKKEKILIIDFNRNINLKDKKEIIKLNNKVDLFFSKSLILKYGEEINTFKKYLFKYLTKFNKIYDFIFIELNINNYFLIKNELKKYYNTIFLIENNFEKIKNNFNIIEKIIENKNIKIILNKTDKYSVNKNIINIILKNVKIIGNIELINNSRENKIIKKEYKKIIKKLNI